MTGVISLIRSYCSMALCGFYVCVWVCVCVCVCVCVFKIKHADLDIFCFTCIKPATQHPIYWMKLDPIYWMGIGWWVAALTQWVGAEDGVAWTFYTIISDDCSLMCVVVMLFYYSDGWLWTDGEVTPHDNPFSHDRWVAVYYHIIQLSY